MAAWLRQYWIQLTWPDHRCQSETDLQSKKPRLSQSHRGPTWPNLKSHPSFIEALPGSAGNPNVLPAETLRRKLRYQPCSDYLYIQDITGSMFVFSKSFSGMEVSVSSMASNNCVLWLSVRWRHCSRRGCCEGTGLDDFGINLRLKMSKRFVGKIYGKQCAFTHTCVIVFLHEGQTIFL